MEDLPFRPNVCMLVVNQSGRLFLGERNGSPGVWQFPQGGVEPHLSEEENVIKELHEELGIDERHIEIVKRLKTRHQYDFSKVPEYAVGKWRGQKQSFWLVRFLGKDSDIKLDRFSPEFSSFRWCTVDEVRSLAEPKRLPGYNSALQEFEELNSLA
ncbi:MAG: NUDIX domain-containing protein [Deltaproteobacteria bacterium]|nr:NUDIX domain-containing protein [Deltaproteobacteria bacterium]